MPQNEFVEQSIRKYGRALDHAFRVAKHEARNEKRAAQLAQTLTGIRARIHHRKMLAEKVQLRRNARAKEARTVATRREVEVDALPAFLLDRTAQDLGRELTSKIKQNRKEMAAKYKVPIAKVEGLSEAQVFGVVASGKRRNRQWKRMVNKPCFVGPDFTRRAPKFERFIRPMGMRFTRAHVTHPELRTTFTLPILAVKSNPHSPLFTSLGVLTRGTILEVNVSELGLVNGSGQVVWGKYAQITNHPENDGCVNAVLLV